MDGGWLRRENRRADAREHLRAALTRHGAQVAPPARDGLSNPDIGAQLFISPRTVQYHLRRDQPDAGLADERPHRVPSTASTSSRCSLRWAARTR
ncbi:MAG: LuxR C-terminal-related transcriptional regulator [Candidatus Velamenicoccus archaeovorus]